VLLEFDVALRSDKIYHGGEDALLDLEPLGKCLFLNLVHRVQVEPLCSGRNQDVFVVIRVFAADIRIDREVLLRKFCINNLLLLGTEELFSFTAFPDARFISTSP
jgi:hypothetical protein